MRDSITEKEIEMTIKSVINIGRCGEINKFLRKTLQIGHKARQFDYVLLIKKFHNELEKYPELPFDLFMGRFGDCFTNNERRKIKEKIYKLIVAEKL